MRRFFPCREVLNIPDQHGHDHVADIRRPAADVGGDDDIGLGEQRVADGEGLPLHAVQPGPGQLAGAHCPDQSLVVHQTAPQQRIILRLGLRAITSLGALKIRRIIISASVMAS